jgi:hypothetical protein
VHNQLVRVLQPRTLLDRKCDIKTIAAIEAARNIAANLEQIQGDFDATFFSSQGFR